MKFATKPIQHYPPRLRHVATLPLEIKSSNFCCRFGRKCKQVAFLIVANFVIRPQILIFSAFKRASFPHTDCK